MKRTTKKLPWTPLVSLGPINFNAPFYINSFADFTLQDKTDSDPVIDWKTYKIRELKTYLHVKDGIVTDCETWLSCVYKGEELIGKTLAEICEMFPTGLAWDGSFGGKSYSQDDMDITFWIEDGIVDSITVGGRDY